MNWYTAMKIMEEIGKMEDLIGRDNSSYFMNIEEGSCLAGIYITNREFKIENKLNKINACLNRIKKAAKTEFINYTLGDKGVFFCIAERDEENGKEKID